MSCFRGLRIPVATVVGLVAQGMREARIAAGYPDLEVEDIQQALVFAQRQPVNITDAAFPRSPQTNVPNSSPVWNVVLPILLHADTEPRCWRCFASCPARPSPQANPAERSVHSRTDQDSVAES